MIRRFIPERQFRDKYGFRWRGGEISRLEAFSDAVFAFSITLLIVSLEVPKTFSELMQTMNGFFGFAASFAILLWIWHIHYMFFRRYGLEDAFTKTINAVLLFVVLFYVYPLKFVFSNMAYFLSGGANETVLASGQVVPILSPGDGVQMMVIYGIGFIAVFASVSLLYWYAGRNKEELRLSELEVALTNVSKRQYLLCILVGVISVALALILRDDNGFYSGISYFLIGPFLWINGMMSRKKVNEIRQRMNLNQPNQQGQRQPREQQRGQQRDQHRQQRPPHPRGQRPQGQQRRHGGQHRPPQGPQGSGEQDQNQQRNEFRRRNG